uniref:Uncharacterized protein n=1 Tax=Anguilla anguilla TaxID=7936 RepID=A0A0E9XJX0_ANGAN
MLRQRSFNLSNGLLSKCSSSTVCYN